MQRPLAARELIWLCDTGTYALYAAVLFRVSMILFMHQNWLLQTQIVGVCLLLSLTALAGSLMPRVFGDPLLYILGAAQWLMAASFFPRYFWPTASLSPFTVYAALALFAFSLVLRFAKRQRWFSRMRGKGWQWIRDWAEDKPYYARRLAQRVLRTLGYAEEA